MNYGNGQLNNPIRADALAEEGAKALAAHRQYVGSQACNQAAAQAIQQSGALEVHANKLTSLLGIVESAMQRARTIADRHLGSEPEPKIAADVCTPGFPSTVSRLDALENSFAEIVGALHRQLERLERL